MVNDPPADLTLTPLNGEGRTIREWLTNFHLLVVVIDPYTNESAWILRTATRVMETMKEADVRVAWVVTADADDARAFLGPLAAEFLTFVDPDRSLVRSLGLERLPALVHLGTDLTVVGSAQGWHAKEWQAVTDRLAKVMSWKGPVLPAPGDPAPYEGSPALG